MRYIQDPVNGEFYPADREEKQLRALELAQKKAKAREAKLAFWIWFINGCLIGWLLAFGGLRCF